MLYHSALLHNGYVKFQFNVIANWIASEWFLMCCIGSLIYLWIQIKIESVADILLNQTVIKLSLWSILLLLLFYGNHWFTQQPAVMFIIAVIRFEAEIAWTKSFFFVLLAIEFKKKMLWRKTNKINLFIKIKIHNFAQYK